MKMKRSQLFTLFIASTTLLNGCATSALWEEGRFSRYYDPAKPNHLRAFHSAKKDDVLVVYDEMRDDDDSVRHRAYWLRDNGGPTPNPHRPHFVSKNATHGLDELPIFERSSTNEPPATGYYLMLADNHQDFALCSNGQNLGDYELPVYRDASGRALQVALTPIAVVADITVVGGLIYAYSMAGSGDSWSP